MAGSRSRRFLDFVASPDRLGRILVIRNGLIGDTVFVTPVLKRLRENFPRAILDFATSSKSLPLLKNYPYVDSACSIPQNYSLAQHSQFFYGLRKNRYDVIVVQEINSHYTAMAKLTAATFVVGFDNSFRFLLDYSVRRRSDVHAAIAELGSVSEWTTPISSDSIELPVTDEEVRQGREILFQSGVTNPNSVVCIHPSCSSANSDKEWKSEYYAELADRLSQEQKAEIVFEGVKGEEELVERIRAQMRSRSLTLVGKTSLRQVLGVLKASRLVIGPDTGTMHLANAVGTPVLMLFGRTDPADTGPFDPTGRSRYVRAELPCIGCIRKSPPPAQWEFCKHIRPVMCMEKLSPIVVYEAAVEVLNGGHYSTGG